MVEKEELYQSLKKTSKNFEVKQPVYGHICITRTQNTSTSLFCGRLTFRLVYVWSVQQSSWCSIESLFVYVNVTRIESRTKLANTNNYVLHIPICVGLIACWLYWIRKRMMFVVQELESIFRISNYFSLFDTSSSSAVLLC